MSGRNTFSRGAAFVVIQKIMSKVPNLLTTLAEVRRLINGRVSTFFKTGDEKRIPKRKHYGWMNSIK
jgi:hypothetical protein